MFFRSDTKCCTYQPSLPNFLVGRILDDDDPAMAKGRATIDARIEARAGVTPLGLETDGVHALLYEHGAARAFGRSRTLRCPHYLDEAGGRCGIWKHRNGVCATWFCKHSRGATGRRFWAIADDLLATVERDVGRWCVLELGLSAEALGALFPHGADRGVRGPLDGPRIDREVDPASYRALWGNWHGREQEMFRESARLVSGLAWREVRAISGAGALVFERLLREASCRLRSDEIPERLVLGSFRVVATPRTRVRVVGYSELDPMELPRVLIDLLPCFDGRPTGQALRRIEQTARIRIEPALVRRLVDAGLLVRRE
jgi:hypothetical protein